MAGPGEHRRDREGQHQAAGRRVAVPGRPHDHRAVRGPAVEPRQRDRAPELRDVQLVHQPGDGPDRAVRQHRRATRPGLHAVQAAGREGRAAAPGRARGQADRADRRAGRLSRRSPSRARTSPTTTATRSYGGLDAGRRMARTPVPAHDVADLVARRRGRGADRLGGRPDAGARADPRAVRRRAAAGRASGRRVPARHRRDGQPGPGAARRRGEVALCSANPLSTQDDVAAALVLADCVEVHARRGEDIDDVRRARARAARGPGGPHGHARRRRRPDDHRPRARR